MNTWELRRWGVWDTERLIHFDLELFIWLEVANGQITTLRWYLRFYYVSCEGKKKKKSLIVIRIHLQKWFSFLQSTCQNSLLSWACFRHSFTYSNIISGTMLGVGENGECSFVGLIATHHSYSSLIIFRSGASVSGKPTHLIHMNLSVRNLTFQL